MDHEVYVLKLQQEKYYIGITCEIENRVFKHFTKKGPDWTRKYSPIELIERIYKANKNIENLKTLEYMMRYGWENVRGGIWYKLQLDHPPLSEWYKEDKPNFFINIYKSINEQLEIMKNNKMKWWE